MVRIRPTILLVLAAVVSATTGLHAEDAWNPFKQNDTRERASSTRERALPQQPPVNLDRGQPAPLDAGSVSIERGDLPPVLANDGSGLPMELWQGLDLPTIEEQVARLESLPRSRALHDLWRRLWTSTSGPPGGGQAESHFAALRIEAMYRAGLLAELGTALGKTSGNAGPLLGALEARVRIGLNDRERGCAAIRGVVAKVSELPKPIATEALLISGYCAAAEGNQAAAGLAADLLRERQAGPSLGLATLDALAAGAKPTFEVPRRVSVLDYRFLQLAGAGGGDMRSLLEKAEPALLAALAREESANPATRVAAAEAAARLDVIGGGALADAYRGATSDAGQPADQPHSHAARELRRAQLFNAAERERAPAAKARLFRDLLDDARREGLHVPVAEAIGRSLEEIPATPELAWFAETAVEASLAAGRGGQARRWAEVGRLRHWMALADIADTGPRGERGADLEEIAELARRGRLSGEFLQRLATVLDALDFQVPIDLWDAANRTPQPAKGHLPETGVLSQLQDAARKKEVGRTALLAMRTLGPDGAEGAHMIALGDSIRALKRVGLHREARRLGFEALFASWPRAASH